MKSEEFWRFFLELRPRLNLRGMSLTKAFEHLDRLDRPVLIVETGCIREAGNWSGDGGSTLLFDKYTEFSRGSKVFSVDIDERATQLCRSLVSKRVSVHTGDSVRFLRDLADSPPDGFDGIDLLYLDSFDVDFDDAFPSAFHHVKELVAAAPLVRGYTLVMVDNSPASFVGIPTDVGKFDMLVQPSIGGKGKFVADYARHVGAIEEFRGYQCGWTGMRDDGGMS